LDTATRVTARRSAGGQGGGDAGSDRGETSDMGAALHDVSEMEALSRTAARLRPWLVRGKPHAEPAVLHRSRPGADPEAVAERLPAGAAVVFRAFGAADAASAGRRLREITNGAACCCWSGRDAALAEAVGADGLHMPERLAADLPRLRAEHPDWLITVAAHDQAAVKAGAAAPEPTRPGGLAGLPQPQPLGGRAAGRGRLEGPSKRWNGRRSTPWAACARTRLRAAADTGIVGIAAVEALAPD
jgi:thiamine-phosphate pyrophosphorylase